MPPIDQTSLHNILLRCLAPEDFALLAPHLEPVELPRNKVLAEPDRSFEHATFPERGILSVISVSPRGRVIESGLVGRDGFTPVSLALDVDRSPQRCIVQVPGEGHRIAPKALRKALARSPALHRLLLRFAHTLAMQTSYTALSNAVHPVGDRIARWLLMCHDRLRVDDLALTHRDIATMLAVRRATVSTTLAVLEGKGLVQTQRGIITIRDRTGLEVLAGDAYGRPEAEYDRVIAPLRQ